MGLLDSMKKELKEEIVREVSEAILADIKELLSDSAEQREKKEPQEVKNVPSETNPDYTELKSTVDELKEALLEVTTSSEKVDEMTVADAYLSLLKE